MIVWILALDRQVSDFFDVPPKETDSSSEFPGTERVYQRIASRLQTE